MLWECSLKHMGSQWLKYFTYYRVYRAHQTHVHTYSKILYVLASEQTLTFIIICQSQYTLQAGRWNRIYSDKVCHCTKLNGVVDTSEGRGLLKEDLDKVKDWSD